MQTLPKLNTTILAPIRDGKPVLAVAPALGISAAVLWSEVAARLAGEFGVIGVDLPGHGASRDVPPLNAMPHLASALLAGVEEALGSGRPFFYAGVSVSGCIGLQLLLDAPKNLAGAAIVSSAAKIGEPADWAERAALVRGKGTKVMCKSSAARWFAPGFDVKNPARVEAILESLAATGAEGYAGMCAALASFDVRDMLGAIARPVIAIGGERDVVTPPEEQRMIAAKIPGARLEILSGVGHLGPAEKPDEVAKLLTDFFKA